MKTIIITTLLCVALLAPVWITALCAMAGKKTPKPGRDFDERGLY